LYKIDICNYAMQISIHQKYSQEYNLTSDLISKIKKTYVRSLKSKFKSAMTYVFFFRLEVLHELIIIENS